MDITTVRDILLYSKDYQIIFLPQRLPFSTFTDYPSEREENDHPPSRLRREVRK